LRYKQWNTDFIHGKEIITNIEVKSGNFSGKGSGIFRSYDMDDFYNDLISAYEKLNGVEVLSAQQDRNFKITLISGKNGQVECEGYYKDSWDYKQELHFIFCDQTFFEKTIGELKSLRKN